MAMNRGPGEPVDLQCFSRGKDCIGSSSAASKVRNVGSFLTSGRLDRRRAALAALCVALIVLATAIQVMHHCTALELNRDPGSAPAFCVICMSAQVAALTVAAIVITISRLPEPDPVADSPIAPHPGACFALSIRPPPSV